MKDVLVGIFVDPIGVMDMTPEEEMDYIEMLFREDIKGFNFEFKRELTPHELSNQSVDVYVFDFGGLLPGCDSLIVSMYRDLLKQIEDHPNTLFFIYGALSPMYYKDELEQMFGEELYEGELKFVNVVLKDTDGEWRGKIAQWLKDTK